MTDKKSDLRPLPPQMANDAMTVRHLEGALRPHEILIKHMTTAHIQEVLAPVQPTAPNAGTQGGGTSQPQPSGEGSQGASAPTDSKK
jgi:hypothetical protein